MSCPHLTHGVATAAFWRTDTLTLFHLYQYTYSVVCTSKVVYSYIILEIFGCRVYRYGGIMPLFMIFIIFNNHSHSTIIHTFILRNSPRPEPVFLNVYGAPESIPRNEFRQPMGRYDNPLPLRFLAPIDSLKIPAQPSCILSHVFSSKEWLRMAFYENASIFDPRNGIPSCFLFRGMVWNGIPRVSFYFCTTNLNSELFRLPRNYFFVGNSQP
jgi:hypothetical protein